MKLEFHLGKGAGSLTVHREEADPKFHGMKHAKGEHRLFHHLRNALNALGFNVLKKRVQSDGHLMGDEFQPYLRTRKPTPDLPHIMVVSDFYALRGANEDWNDGVVNLRITYDAFEQEQDTRALIAKLLKGKGVKVKHV
jgi:hypothetical protein